MELSDEVVIDAPRDVVYAARDAGAQMAKEGGR